VGNVLRFSPELTARVAAISIRSRRQVDLAFDLEGSALVNAIYAIGRPIQYAHVPAPLDLWSVQNAYASRPWAVENPSAGRPLRARTFASWPSRR
jgi:S-adenosylmethionine:tRNA ribosyltransferase-isomerase